MGSHARNYLSVNALADGENALITGVQNRQVRVVAYDLTVTGTGVSEIRQTNDTVLGRLGVGVHVFSGGDGAPAVETAQGQGLEVNNAAGVDVVGHLTYELV